MTAPNFTFAMLTLEYKGEFMSEEAAVAATETPAPTVKITVRPNGPFRVEGPISLVDVNGQAWDLTGKPAISLCRCGLSLKRPFCDGTHGREGWKCDASPVPVETVALG
jgi:CDGSH-type Zn-finger protein